MGSILVVGAGELGLAVILELASLIKYGQKHGRELGQHITVLLSPSTSTTEARVERAKRLASIACDTIQHDISIISVSDLASAFKPFDAVVCCTGFVGGAGTQIKITQAVLNAHVKRYIPWQFDVDYDEIGRGSGQYVFDEQLDVRDMLYPLVRGVDPTEWVIISTGIFLSFLFEESFGIVVGVKEQGDQPITCRALGSWGNELSVTSVEDIGRLTALLLLDEGFRNEVVFVAGDTISYASLADIVGKVKKRVVHRELWTEQQLREALRLEPTNTMRSYRAAFALGKGVAWDKSETFNDLEGIETTTVEQWLISHSKA
jgi:hypothetical protein